MAVSLLTMIGFNHCLSASMTDDQRDLIKDGDVEAVSETITNYQKGLIIIFNIADIAFIIASVGLVYELVVSFV